LIFTCQTCKDIIKIIRYFIICMLNSEISKSQLDKILRMTNIYFLNIYSFEFNKNYLFK